MLRAGGEYFFSAQQHTAGRIYWRCHNTQLPFRHADRHGCFYFKHSSFYCGLYKIRPSLYSENGFKHLGYFHSEEEAVKVRKKNEKIYYGEFRYVES